MRTDRHAHISWESFLQYSNSTLSLRPLPSLLPPNTPLSLDNTAYTSLRRSLIIGFQLVESRGSSARHTLILVTAHIDLLTFFHERLHRPKPNPLQSATVDHHRTARGCGATSPSTHCRCLSFELSTFFTSTRLTGRKDAEKAILSSSFLFAHSKYETELEATTPIPSAYTAFDACNSRTRTAERHVLAESHA